MNNDISAYISSIIAFCISCLFALGCSQGGIQLNGIPIVFLCLIIIFLIQWVVFLPSYFYHTEHYYDLTGSLTYIIVIGLSFYWRVSILNDAGFDIRSFILLLLVLLWAIRLGSFLFHRILIKGEDHRFNVWKYSFPLFLRTWTYQGMWIFFTSLASITAITSDLIVGDDLFLYLGLLIWIFGFSFETIADQQKKKFNSNKKNKSKFISSGLWSISRHPNYFGEVMLWLGIAIIAFPVLKGWQMLSLISPVFVYLLLTKGSGVPILEANADKKWGNNKKYQTYKSETPIFFPRIFKK